MARRYGADVPFARPSELAQDHSEDWAVFKHALDWLLQHDAWQPNLVVNLRPTSPLRTPAHVDRAVAVCPAAEGVVVAGHADRLIGPQGERGGAGGCGYRERDCEGEADGGDRVGSVHGHSP